MKNTLHLFLLLMYMGVNAQVFPVQVLPQLVPPYSPFLSDYTAAGAQNLTLSIRTNDVTLNNYPCKLKITIEGVGITITTKQNFVARPLTLEGGGVPQIFYGRDLAGYFDPNALDFSGITRREYEKSARLPEGIYRFTIEVLDYYRGTVVSNKGMATAWIVHNDPPLLNLPSNFANLTIQEPTNILFTWTPRHTGSPNAAFSTEYIFRLVELWPENRDPHDAFLTQYPLFEISTTQTQTLYGLSEPALIPGRKYAWQVEARDIEGKDLFKNNGRSEVFVFKYGEPLAFPQNLDMRWAKPTALAIRWDPVRDDREEIKYRLQYRPRRRSEPHDWYETRTQFTEKTLYQLQPNTEYEMRVRAERAVEESQYTDIRIFKTLSPEVSAFVCNENVKPPPVPENTFPVFPLSINDTLHAGGYQVLVRDVMQIDGHYYGSGFAVVPWLNGAKVRVTFEKISVNERFWLRSGTIKSVWNPETNFLLETKTPVTAGNAPQTGELDITVVAADSLIIIHGAAIAAVTKDEEGNILVTTTDGKEQVLPKGESYALADDAGNGYVIDKQGNIAKTSATEARASAARGDRNYNQSFQFSKGKGKFGFDEKKFNALSAWYQQIGDGTYVAWKALSTAQSDVIEGELLSGDIDLNRLRFEAGTNPVMPTSSGQASLTLNLQGKIAGMEEELLALYTDADTLPDKVLGKINLATYNPIQYNLQVVPVNGATMPGGLTAGDISEKLNEVFSQAVVGWTVRVSTPLSLSLGERFDEGETGLFSNYTAGMKKVLQAYGRLHDNTYYLFLISEPRNGSSLGYMPRNKQAGFVFVGPHKNSAQEFLKTLAHELGHGAFNLKHTFIEHTLPSGSTDNLMDYSPGTALYKYQWDYIHEPQSVIGLFEGEEEGEMSIPEFESVFARTLGEEFLAHPCLAEALAHGTKVFRRFDLDVALYSSFLRLMLCGTRKENCIAINYQTAFSCGFTNALLQEIDWITMLESIEGIGIDPEKVLLCILDSYPIGGPENKVKLGKVAFKCLVGIDVSNLITGIKDFITATSDDPYYQGQATAFALTLFSPFKGKVVTKMADLPQFVGKMDDFKALSKARNSDELIEISKILEKLVDDAEVEKLAMGTKFLPDPLLPPKIAATFTNSVYTNRKLLESERYLKYHGIDNRTGKKYSWLVNKKYDSEQRLREGLAIRHDWGVIIEFVSEFEVPPGTWVSEGKAASQGIGYPGGEYQAVILNIPKTWILKTTGAF